MRVPHSSAITKLQALLVINLIIVALAAGGYYYVNSLPRPIKKAEFQIVNFAVDPVEAGVGQPIIVSVNVTNVGEEAGNYSVNLTINDVLKDTKTIQLLGNESKMVEFVVAENNEGSYSVRIGELSGTFIIINEPLPASLEVYDLIISPHEGWVNEPIRISVKARNHGDETISYPLAFRVDNVVRETKTIQLSAGEITSLDCTVTESSEGTYSVIVGGKFKEFNIVPTDKHTLQVITGYADLDFTLDGKKYSTPYSELLEVGTHTIAVPDTLVTRLGGIMEFSQWSDGDESPTKTINLQSWMALSPEFVLISGKASCPSLYVWNGKNYLYCTEVSSGTGYLGILDYFRVDGTIAFAYSYPWDYIKLEGNQLQPKDGYYDMKLTQEWDEIFYLDVAQLLVVDHSPDVDVFSTKGTYIYNLDGQGKIYTISKNPLPPISCVNDEGEDCLPQISKLDGIYTKANKFQYDNLTLNLGDLSDAKEIKIVVAGKTLYTPGEEQGAWAAKFATQPGVKPFPPPYMEVKNRDGNWVRVPDNRQFPLLDVTSNRFVVNLTGLFPTNDYSLRIHTFFNAPFDYIGVDTTPQENVKIHVTNLSYANLYPLAMTSSNSTGDFTRFGEVTSLMLEADDEFVIGRQGDEVSLKFPSVAPSEGMERDYFLVVSCWFKVDGLPYLDFTVNPLPFHDMSCFPYASTESYPYDTDHTSYLLEYNTRTIIIPQETE